MVTDLKDLFFVVSDLDETLANGKNREGHLKATPPNWTAFFDACETDEPIWPVIKVLSGLTSGFMGCRIEIWTGRPERVRVQTERWLDRHRIRYARLRMRADGDFRPDTIVKGEWLADYSKLPDLMLDDRTRSVAYWRSLGIRTLQVADNDF